MAISRKTNTDYDSTVRYGPFSRLKLSNDPWWGAADRASILIGVYEKELLDSLLRTSGSFTNFIEIEAADGYYGLGDLVGNLLETAGCYEMSEKGRSTIRDNAIKNNDLDKISIKELADKDFHREISYEVLRNIVLFIDAEGAEFDMMYRPAF